MSFVAFLEISLGYLYQSFESNSQEMNKLKIFISRESGEEESEIRVGFVTYGKELHFYNIKVTVLL